MRLVACILECAQWRHGRFRDETKYRVRVITCIKHPHHAVMHVIIISNHWYRRCTSLHRVRWKVSKNGLRHIIFVCFCTTARLFEECLKNLQIIDIAIFQKTVCQSMFKSLIKSKFEIGHWCQCSKLKVYPTQTFDIQKA